MSILNIIIIRINIKNRIIPIIGLSDIPNKNARPMLINIKSVVNGLIPISKAAISGIALIACPSCFIESMKLLSVIIIAGRTNFPAMPVTKLIKSPARFPNVPLFLRDPTIIVINKVANANNNISGISFNALLIPDANVVSFPCATS